mgnify:CR=1 FL=1
MYAARNESNTFARGSVFGRLLASLIAAAAVLLGYLPMAVLTFLFAYPFLGACWTFVALKRLYRSEERDCATANRFAFLNQI